MEGRAMKKTFNIYDISKGVAVFVQEVEKESDAQGICREHNKAGERNYMYLPNFMNVEDMGKPFQRKAWIKRGR